MSAPAFTVRGMDISLFQAYDRKGNRILIANDGLSMAIDARTQGTIGVWDLREDTGWTKDDRDFIDLDEWKAAVDEILAASGE